MGSKRGQKKRERIERGDSPKSSDRNVYFKKTSPGSDCALNALAIDEPLEYARLYLDETMQMWVDAEDSLEI